MAGLMKKYRILITRPDPKQVGWAYTIEAQSAANAISKALRKARVTPDQVSSGEFNVEHKELTNDN